MFAVITISVVSYCMMAMVNDVGATQFKLIPTDNQMVMCPNAKSDVTNFKNIKILFDEKKNQHFFNGTFQVLKKMSAPMTMNVIISQKKQGVWVEAWRSMVPNICDEMLKKDKPWSMFFDQIDVKQKTCPIQPSSIDIVMAPIVVVEKFDDDVSGTYKATIESFAMVDLVRKQTACVYFNIELEETEE